MKMRTIVLALAFVGFASAYPTWPDEGYSDQQSEGAAPRAMNAFDWAVDSPNDFSQLQSERGPLAEPDAFLETENFPFDFKAEEERPYDGELQSKEDPETEMNGYPAAEMSEFDVDDKPIFVQEETFGEEMLGVQGEDFGTEDEPEGFFQEETAPEPGEEAVAQAEDLLRLQEYVDAHMKQTAEDVMEYAGAQRYDFA